MAAFIQLGGRKAAQVLGEISYLCSLGQCSELVIPDVMERVRLLIPASFYGCTWTDRRGTIQRVYCNQSGILDKFEIFAAEVADRSLEAEALVPTRDLFLRRVPFANSESHTRNFCRSFYYNELLRPVGLFHTGRFQIIPETGSVGKLFGARAKSDPPF